jgi:hypothetical protein
LKTSRKFILDCCRWETISKEIVDVAK